MSSKEQNSKKEKLNLLTTYENTLKLGGFVVDSEGFISNILAGSKKKIPAIIQLQDPKTKEKLTKRLVLPTPNQLQDPSDASWDNRFAFHIFKENVFKGESQVISYFRVKINYRLNIILKTLIKEVLNYGSLPLKQENKLARDYIELAQATKEIDEKALTTLTSLINNLKPTNRSNGAITSIYLKKMGKVSNTLYSCVFVINFPFYEELCAFYKEWSSKNNEFYGVQLRKKDVEILKSVIEYIIPHIEKHIKEDNFSYNYGVEKSASPFAEALLRGIANFSQPLNKVLTLLLNSGIYTNEEKELLESTCYVDLTYLEALDDFKELEKEIRLIPQLPGNEEAEERSISPEAQPMTPPSQHRWQKLTTEDLPASSPNTQPTIEEKAGEIKEAFNQPKVDEKKSIDQLSWNAAQRRYPPQQGQPTKEVKEISPQTLYPAQYPQGPLVQQGYPQGYPQQNGYPYPPNMLPLGYPPQQGYPIQQQVQPQYPQQGYPQGYPQVQQQSGYPSYPGVHPMNIQGYPQPNYQGYPQQGQPLVGAGRGYPPFRR